MSWRARLSTNLRELRFLFSESAKHSEGTRRFVENNYSELKALNPKLPFLIRTGTETRPIVVARYDYGAEKLFNLDDLSEQEVTEKVRELAFIGTQTLKATAFPWQESVPQDVDVVDYKDVSQRGW
eukprot:TRINITY_DN4017_c0_g1_i2.p1 TRINITY_DN4017_c0_g1~~TRINITY_DN4017_c0_g1_i2.p1  ORF type:complete len:126 (-),score=32.39 TRINITY_DN4017_c0_g1_i2:188-565(-)